MKFICLGFFDEEHWNALPEEERTARMTRCLEYDQVLRAGNHFAGGAALAAAKMARTLQWKDGKVVVTDGPFAETKEILGGILELEAASLDEAVELMKKHPGVRMGPFEIRGTVELPQVVDEQAQIRERIAAWSRALEARDIDALMAFYLPEAIQYDLIPPYKTVGREAIRAAWEHCLPYFPEGFGSEHRDLTIEVDGNLAYVFCLHHFVAENHPCGQSWFRVTVGFRRVNGQWRIAHEHVSLPYNPMSNEVWKITDPEQVNRPDYPTCQTAAT